MRFPGWGVLVAVSRFVRDLVGKHLYITELVNGFDGCHWAWEGILALDGFRLEKPSTGFRAYPIIQKSCDELCHYLVKRTPKYHIMGGPAYGNTQLAFQNNPHLPCRSDLALLACQEEVATDRDGHSHSTNHPSLGSAYMLGH